MAIDSAEKRRSVSQLLSGLFGPGVTPNSGKDQEWRQQSGWGYSGILADNPGAPTTFGLPLISSGLVNRGIVNAGLCD